MEAIDLVVDFCAQSVAHTLAHHRALFARDESEIALDRRIKVTSKCDVQAGFTGPAGSMRREIA